MGQRTSVICLKCGHKFKADEGGGFTFRLLHCDSCSKTKSIPIDDFGNLHPKYLKGLKGPDSEATKIYDKHIQNNCKGKALSWKKRDAVIEKIVGNCKCGGSFKFNAKARCPKCKSLKFKEDKNGGVVQYD